MTIFDPSRRDMLAGSALAGAGLVAGLGGEGAGQAQASTPAMPKGDPTPFVAPPLPPPLTAPAAIARLAGVDLWYWDTGGPGPVVVLQHAMTGSGHVWGYQQQVFARAGYRVIGYSRRGYRESSAGDPNKPGTAVEDLRMLLDHLKIERCHVVGTAGGGLVSGGFGLHYPGRTLTITIACSMLTLTEPKVLELLSLRGEPFSGTLPHHFTELSPSYRALCKEGVALWKDLAHKARAEQGNVLPAQPYGGPETLADIGRIGVPTLLIYGDADLGCCPPMGRLFHKAIPNSEFVVFTETGHSAYWERPAEFNAVVLDFMKRRTRA